MPGDEELGDRHQGVEEGTHAEDDQQDLDHVPTGVGRVLDRADGGDRVEGPDHPVAHRDVLAEHEADRSEGDQGEDQQAEDRKPPQERQQLAAHRRPRPAEPRVLGYRPDPSPAK